MFNPITTLKEFFDQVLHATWAGSMTFLFSLNIGIWLGGALAMVIMLVREVAYQHPLQCGIGCRTDLLGSFVGVVIAAIIVSI